MNYIDEFLLIAVAHFFAVASPGPDFAVVLKQSVQHGRRNALWTSAGVGAAILLHIAYCVLGVALVLTQSPALFMALKYIAGAYLAYLGVQALRAAKPTNTSIRTDCKTQPCTLSHHGVRFDVAFLPMHLTLRQHCFLCRCLP